MNAFRHLLSAQYIHIGGMIVLASLALFHAGIAPVMFKELSGRFIWYIATDLGVMTLIFLNVAATYVPTEVRTPWTLCHVANGFGVALGILNFMAVPEPINILVMVGYGLLAGGGQALDDRSLSHAIVKKMR